MRESRPSGSERGAARKGRPYRDLTRRTNTSHHTQIVRHRPAPHEEHTRADDPTTVRDRGDAVLAQRHDLGVGRGRAKHLALRMEGCG